MISMETKKRISELLFNLFVNRTDISAIQREDGAYHKILQPLSVDIIERHLKGELTTGIYQIDPKDNSVKWICFDLDGRKIGGNVDTKAKEICEVASERLNLNAILLEASGSPSSYHVWIFFDPSIPASIANFLGKRILEIAKVKDAELFPKQTKIAEDRFGNLVKMPLGYHKRAQRWSTFLNPQTLAPIDPSCLENVVPVSISDHDVQRLEKEVVYQKRGKRFEKVLAEKPYRGQHPICVLKLLQGVKLGERDEVAIRLAGYFHVERGLSEGETLKKLLDWNQSNGPPMGENPGDPSDVESYFLEKIRSAEKMEGRFGCESLFRFSGICSGKENCEYFCFYRKRRRREKWSITISRSM